MIPLLLAALLSGGDTDDLDLFMRLRGGAWASGGFEFDALVATGRREISGGTLASIGADAGVVLSDHYMVFGGAEFAAARDLDVTTLNLSVGYTMRVEKFSEIIPEFRFSLTAGLLWGRFNVDQPDFGDFKDGLGFRAGADFLFDLNDHLAIGGYVEGRAIRFEYDRAILDGDDHAGGGGFAAGLTFEVRW